MEMLTLLGNIAEIHSQIQTQMPPPSPLNFPNFPNNNNKNKTNNRNKIKKKFYRRRILFQTEEQNEQDEEFIHQERCHALVYQNKVILDSVQDHIHKLLQIITTTEQIIQGIHLRKKWNNFGELQTILFQLTTFNCQLTVILTALQSSRQAVLNTVLLIHKKTPEIRSKYIEYRQHYNSLCALIYEATQRSIIVVSSLELIFFFEN